MRHIALYILLLSQTCCATNWLNLKQGELLKNAEGKTFWRPVPVNTYINCGEHAMNAYKKAIKFINGQAGCRLLAHPVRYYGTPSEGALLGCWNRPGGDEEGDMGHEGAVGLCESWIDDKTAEIERSVLHIPCFRPFPEMTYYIAVHELLHALGFAHDRELGTILYPNVAFASPVIQDADLELLRNMCQERQD